MPSTGAPDSTLFLMLILFGMSLLAIGLVARRSIASGKQ
jgi:LPXTG-motif cell wall-anchored protein